MSNLVTKVAKNRVFNDVAYQDESFPALRLARAARAVRTLGRVLLYCLIILIIVVAFAPWQQFIRGEGDVIAFDPFERPQVVQAPVKGRIAERGENVQENAYVEKGDLLFRIEDQDPLYLSRLEQQVTYAETELAVARERLLRAKSQLENISRIVEVTNEELGAMQTARTELLAAYDSFILQADDKLKAERNKLLAAEAKEKQSRLDFDRKKALFDEGIASELKMQEAEQKFRDAEAYVGVAKNDVSNAENGLKGKKSERASYDQEWQAKINKVQSNLEKARADVAKAGIDIDKTNEEINQKQSKLLDAQRKLAVQRTQEVRAPRDGYIMNLAVFDAASIVKEGDQLCRIVPKTEDPAVQIWVAGNDAPLIQPDENGNPRKVRLQFEGWPAVQFSGWPSVAMGTFGGEVALVDPTDNGMGKFRVVIKPDPDDLPWPEHPYLRQGVRANGWIQLDQVPLAYEIWRRMNGFPPSLKSKGDEEKFAKPPVKGKTTS